ncbi:hypothetical protein BC629DRAFT_1440222 [Irpex lacteus]|nr:hypothetical protein BC629DRAFT_1440222 [Irpex lacteus]
MPSCGVGSKCIDSEVVTIWHVRGIDVNTRVERSVQKAPVEPPNNRWFLRQRRNVLVVGWDGALYKTSGTNGTCSFDMESDHVISYLQIGIQKHRHGRVIGRWVWCCRALHQTTCVSILGSADGLVTPSSSSELPVAGVYDHDKGGRRWLTVEGLRRDLYEDLRRDVLCSDFLQTYGGSFRTISAIANTLHVF